LRKIRWHLERLTRGFSWCRHLRVEKNDLRMIVLIGRGGNRELGASFGDHAANPALHDIRGNFSRVPFEIFRTSRLEKCYDMAPASKAPRTLAEQIADLDDPTPRGTILFLRDTRVCMSILMCSRSRPGRLPWLRTQRGRRVWW
jgi:hypothetical protein